jgi:uncharacterized membrane protein YuzA (DUF378 family)
MESEKIGSHTIDALLTVVVAVAAANWAAVEFADTDLLVDVLGLTGDTLTITYGVIGALAVVVVYNTWVWYSDGVMG